MEHKDIQAEIAEQPKRGVLLVLTGPSGAGKDTVIARLFEKNPHLKKIITTTSRSLREGEKEGEPYHFISREEFERLIAEGAFYEWVEFRGELYGTQKATLESALATGDDVIWKIETKGVKNIKQKIKETFPRSVFAYLTGPRLEIMKHRVEQAEGEQAAKRWNEPLVVWEMKQYQDSDYLIVNEDGQLETAVGQLEAILVAKRLEIQDRLL